MAINRVQLLSVPVSDQDRAKSFYVDTLGFDLLRDDAMGPDQRWVQVAPRGADTSLTLVTWLDAMEPGSLDGVVIETDDIDTESRELSERGVSFNGDIQDAPWGRWLTFQDPDGNGFVLQESAPGGG